MSIVLFPVDGVRRVVEASKVNPSTRPPYGIGDPLTEPHVLVVKDDGIYLLPHYVKEEGVGYPEEHVVYADGFNPNTDPDVWERSRAAAGGDDFVEAIPASHFTKILEAASKLEKDHIYVMFESTRIEIGIPTPIALTTRHT